MSYDVSKQFLWPGCRIRPLFYPPPFWMRWRHIFIHFTQNLATQFRPGGNNLEIKITKFNQDRSLVEMFKCTNKVLEIHWFKCFQHHWTYVPPFSCCWQIVVKIRKPLQQIRCRAVPVICINWCISVKSRKDWCICGWLGWEELLPCCCTFYLHIFALVSVGFRLCRVSPKFLGEAALGFAAIKTSPLATKCLGRHKMRQSGNILCPGTPQSCGTPK